MIKQRVVKFGAVTPLAGVLTEPVGGTLPNRPAVLVLNSGILHHVGANRLHVQIARRLSELGFATLRFDFSGLGDSEPRRDHLSFEESGPLETKEAMDFLARTLGAKQFVLLGLCSGADAAHLAALSHESIVGLGLLDAWAYRTPRYYAHYYGRRIVSPAIYRRWLRVRFSRLRGALAKAVADERDPEMYDMPEYIRVFPPRDRVAAELRQFMARQLQLMVVFSGGLEEYNHQGQYRASFPDVPFANQLRELHVPNATHVFTALAHQEIVVRELSRWVAEHFSAAGMLEAATQSA